MASQLLQRPLLLERSLTQYRISVQRYNNVSAVPLVAEYAVAVTLVRCDEFAVKKYRQQRPREDASWASGSFARSRLTST